jgi:hypothetical protein
MHKIYLDGVTRFCETSELSFFKKLGYQEVEEKPSKAEKVEEEVEEDEPAASETEGIFSIPDTPEERGIDMKSSDEEVEKIMSGTDVEKEDAKEKK